MISVLQNVYAKNAPDLVWLAEGELPRITRCKNVPWIAIGGIRETWDLPVVEDPELVSQGSLFKDAAGALCSCQHGVKQHAPLL